MNIQRTLLKSLRATILGIGAAFGFAEAEADTLYGVNFSELVTFDSADPSTTLTTAPLSGLNFGGGEFYSILEIDFRPSTGMLYGLGNSPGSLYRLFSIDIATGAATSIGSSFAQSASAFSLGFDFDPVTDRIRLVNNAQQNGRLDPATGVYTADPNLTLGPATPNVVSAAHSNSYAGATSTTLYDISADNGLNSAISYVQSPPDSGQLIFASGVLLDSVVPTSELGFDLSAANLGFVSTPDYDSGTGTFNTRIYAVDPTSGGTTLLGTRADFIRDIAVAPAAVPEPSTLALLGLGILGGCAFLPRPKTNRDPLLRFFLALCLALGFALSARAQTFPDLYANANGEFVENGASESVSAASAGPTRNFYLNNSAYAAFGVIKLVASVATIDAVDGSGSLSSASYAGFNDIFTIDSPGLHGTAGVVSVSYAISGAFSLAGDKSPDTYIASELNVRLNGSDAGAMDTPMFTKLRDGSEFGTNFFGAPRSLTVNFVFGEPIFLSFSLMAAANFVNGEDGGSFASADLGHSAYWGGISAVATSGGMPVTDFTSTSDSGTNYIAPVPEPSAIALFGIGAAAIVLIRYGALAGARRRPAGHGPVEAVLRPLPLPSDQ